MSSVLGGIEGTALAYTENDAATAITATITASDVDNTNLSSATIQITGNYQNGTGRTVLRQHGQHHRELERDQWHVDPERQRYGRQLPSRVAGLTYRNTSENPSGLMRTVSFTVNDGTAGSNTVARNIAVAPRQ